MTTLLGVLLLATTAAAAGFTDEDNIRFQNAACAKSQGGVKVLQAYLDRGYHVDTVDLFSEDTALIKAAKFCQRDAVELLLQHGANKQHRTDGGLTAYDYAVKSNFHKGCPELVTLLKPSVN